MNDSIRESVREAMEKYQLSQVDLAKDIGVTKQYLNNYLNGKDGDVPKLWQKVFDTLGLELIVKNKEKKVRAKTKTQTESSKRTRFDY
jgi:ribosome-binding protein aMBF1 (putative translation factor)